MGFLTGRSWLQHKMLRKETFVCIIVFSGCVHGLLSNGTRASSKKGVSVGSSNFMCGDFDILHVSWFYNRGPNPDMGGCGPQKNFVPMLWNFYGPPELSGFDTVLGFNEPNFGEQSNISPQDAATYWIQIQDAYPDKTLVAPCPAPGGSNMDPFTWYDQFFDACSVLGCRVDYIATHSYSGCADCDWATCGTCTVGTASRSGSQSSLSPTLTRRGLCSTTWAACSRTWSRWRLSGATPGS